MEEKEPSRTMTPIWSGSQSTLALGISDAHSPYDWLHETFFTPHHTKPSTERLSCHDTLDNRVLSRLQSQSRSHNDEVEEVVRHTKEQKEMKRSLSRTLGVIRKRKKNNLVITATGPDARLTFGQTVRATEG